jgi:hypothetical protein
MEQSAVHDRRLWIAATHRPLRWRAVLRLVVMLAPGLVGGCSEEVALREPVTGRTEICRDGSHGLNPWSQTLSCIADHEAQGWVRVGQD